MNASVRSLSLLLMIRVDTVHAGPKAFCPEPTFDFGEREMDEKVEHTFTILNTGDEGQLDHGTIGQ